MTLDNPLRHGDHDTTLPAEAMTSGSVFADDVQRVFMRSWLCCGTSDAVRDAGTYSSIRVVGQNVLVVRDRQGTLRAFHNVCSHRGALLCEAGSGRTGRSLVCPYHAWTYGLDGQLVGTPNVSTEEIDRTEYGLRGLPIAEWQGLLFVDLGGQAGSFEQWLANFGFGAADLGEWNLSGLVMGKRTERIIEANWKIVVENYLECLHCPSVHPELSKAVPLWGRAMIYDPDTGDGSPKLAQALTLDGTPSLPPLRQLTDEEAGTLYSAYLFPATMLNLFGAYLLTAFITPVSASRTAVVVSYSFDPETVSSSDFDPSAEVDFIEMVAAQDARVCELTQQGLTSRAYIPSPLPRMEADLAEFHRFYRMFNGTDASDTAPTAPQTGWVEGTPNGVTNAPARGHRN